MLNKTLVQSLYLNKESYPSNHLLNWVEAYKSIHGTHQSQRQVDKEALEHEYDIKISNQDDLYWLINCLERFYEIALRTICANSLTPKRPSTKEICMSEFFNENGLSNYLDGIPTTWLDNLDDTLIEEGIKNLWESSQHLIQQNNSSNVIHNLFEDVFPRAIRHSLGEYYTPSWLVDFTTSLLTVDNNITSSKIRILDPTCGSGSFISGMIKKLHQNFSDKAFEMVEGFDIRWQSVLAARTNFVLQYINLVGSPRNLYIPIWQKDIFQDTEGQINLFTQQHLSNTEIERKYDHIIGNPPWVNWEYLPQETKKRTAKLWELYGLWTSKGMDKGFIKEDISSLATYTVADKFLKSEGYLYFVLKESLFKSSKQGEGFRNFRIRPTKENLCPIRIDDFSNLNTFEGASARAFLVSFQKGKHLQFPVKFLKWKNKRTQSKKVKNIDELFNEEMEAIPSDKNRMNSGWLSYISTNRESLDRFLGESFYKARTGVFTGGLNAVFWIDIIDNSSKNVRIKNITKRAKNKVKEIDEIIEANLLYPLAGGSDLKYWDINYSKYIILPHTSETKMKPINHKALQKYPKTLKYLENFQKELADRKGFTTIDRHIRDEYFYTLQRIGSYTFAKYKVGWKYISKEFTPCVFSTVNDKYLGEKLIIPNEKIIYIGLEDEAEAYYLCGLLSSSQYKSTIHSYTVGTQITPSIIKKLKIQKYQPENKNHAALSTLCKLGHESSLNIERKSYQEEISAIVEKLSK